MAITSDALWYTRVDNAQPGIETAGCWLIHLDALQVQELRIYLHAPNKFVGTVCNLKATTGRFIYTRGMGQSGLHVLVQLVIEMACDSLLAIFTV